MKYSTKISRRQVILAFDRLMKRRAALAWKYPYPFYHETLLEPPQLVKKPLPPALTMKAISQKCCISYSTLLRLIDSDFRLAKFKRPKVVSFANRYYRA
jgi:AraC-like DNA-binding protein